ncbi:hypothetical protein pdam_00011093, partial [Pocillopora damicornis]
MQAVLRLQKGGHGPRRSLRKPRKLGMRVQQLVLSYASSSNYDAEMNTSLAEKIKNVRDHNFEGGANNSELDKDTDRSNLN